MLLVVKNSTGYFWVVTEFKWLHEALFNINCRQRSMIAVTCVVFPRLCHMASDKRWAPWETTYSVWSESPASLCWWHLLILLRLSFSPLQPCDSVQTLRHKFTCTPCCFLVQQLLLELESDMRQIDACTQGKSSLSYINFFVSPFVWIWLKNYY